MGKSLFKVNEKNVKIKSSLLMNNEPTKKRRSMDEYNIKLLKYIGIVVM